MKRLCVIGDSHTAALRQGWQAIKRELTEINITFFSAHRTRFVDLAVCGDRLVPQSEELSQLLGRTNSEPVIRADYDRYVLCGLDYSILWAMGSLMSFRSEDQALDNRAPISQECYLLAMAGLLRGSINLQVARKVRAIADRPITIIPAPCISDATELKLYPRLEKTGDAQKIADYFAAASDILCREIDAEVLWQPAETLRDPLRTLAIFGKDAPREFTDAPKPDGWKDHMHMNGEYGALVLRALIATPGL
ncbi:MAG TPA: hypothetical protein VGG36_05015 [Rhizomicrobium sp.]|jgi:hypothetical protein